MVNVRKQNGNNRIKVSANRTANIVTTHYTTDIIAQGLAKDWAVKMDGIVDNTDYSSKYYAAQAKTSENNAQQSAELASSQAELARNYAQQAETTVRENMVIATTNRVGGIKVGSNLSITEEGILNTNADILGVYTKTQTDNLLSGKLDSTSLPTNVSAFNNDAGYQTQTQVASSISSATTDFSNKSISNLSNNGEARLHALKSYLDESELLTDSDGLAFVKKYAHSTFDKSKFTVVGNPIITDDGIASGFSSGNYIQTPINLNNSKPFKYKLSFKTSTIANTTEALVGTAWNNAHVKIEGNQCRFYYNSSYYVGFAVASNTSYDIIAEYDGNTTIKLYYKQSSENEYNLTQNQTVEQGSNTSMVRISHWDNSLPQPFTGSIDLKQFSIIVDGVEVFSGNKTGIDTIKPDDYTVVGSPTISADGVASGFSKRANYLYTPLDLSNANTFDIEFECTCGATTGTIIPFDYGTNYQSTWGTSLLRLQQSGSGSQRYFVMSGEATYNHFAAMEEGHTYKFHIHYVASITTATIKQYENGQLISTSITSRTAISQSGYLIIGGSLNANDAWSGSIDLNTVKIYANGNLVYQPCLKIPYTESKTGSKIVDSIYRDRVADMSAQFGFAPYYTLSDTDFTLPQGELYGMKADIDFNNINKKAKILMSRMGMPSTVYTDLTLGSNGSTYTAPANGYFVCFGYNATAGTTKMINTTTGIGSASEVSAGAYNPLISIPVCKGDIVELSWNNGTLTIHEHGYFRFVYAKGSENEGVS